MTVGIMTFHWAANYGAVLQAFALQEFLRELGFDAAIINYLPRRLILRDTARLIARGRIKTLRVRRQKEQKIKQKTHKNKIWRKKQNAQKNCQSSR